MKILLTGATGLIGKETGKLLAELGHEVIAVSRDAGRAKASLPFLSECIEWKDFSHEFSPEDQKKIQGLDAVVNLMGESLMAHRWTDAFKAKLISSRVDSTRGLVRNLTHTGLPKVWLQGSAIGYYGESKGVTPFNEASPRGEGFLADFCEKWEAEIKSLPAEVRRVVMRTGVVLSHQGGAFPQMIDPLMKGIGGVVGSGEQRLSLIHLTDMVRFIETAIKPESKMEGDYNLVCKETITQRDLTERLCERLWLKQGPKIPGLVLKLLLGEMSELVLGSLAVSSTRLSEAGFELQYPQVNPVLDEVTSWHQHPYEKEKAVCLEYSEQFVPKNRDAVFPFFSDASNLEKLTPDFLTFKVKEISTDTIQAGTHILYDLKLHGIPFEWLTLIATWSPPFSFTDQQVKGPYALWHHEHLFKEVRGTDGEKTGTLIQDWVRYELPLGKAGQLVGLTKVRDDVQKIFQYRRKVIANTFAQNAEPESPKA